MLSVQKSSMLDQYDADDKDIELLAPSRVEELNELVPTIPAHTVSELPGHTDQQSVAWRLAKDFPFAIASRLASIVFFYVTFQLYLRQNQESLAKGAVLAIFFNVSSVLRELERMVTNMTKEEVDKGVKLAALLTGRDKDELIKIITFIRSHANDSDGDLVDSIRHSMNLHGVGDVALERMVQLCRSKQESSGVEIIDEYRTSVNQGVRDMFLATDLSTVVPTILTYGINQFLILAMYASSDSDISKQYYHDLMLYPSIFFGNYLMLNILTAKANRSYALNELKQLLVIFPLGAVSILGSYFGWRLLLPGSPAAMMLANTTQNFVLCVMLSAKDQIYHAADRLFHGYLEGGTWKRGLLRALEINRKSVQFAVITGSELIADVMWAPFLRDKAEAASVVALKFVTNIFLAMGAYEQTLVVKIIEANNAHQHDPQRLRRELINILTASSVITASLPLIFSVAVLILGKQFLVLLISDTEENKETLDKASRDLIYTCGIIVLKCISSAPFAMITAFRSSELSMNRLATAAKCTAPLVTLGLGIAGDYLGYGATGFWAGSALTLFLSTAIQYYAALRVIANRARLASNETVGSTNAWCIQFRPRDAAARPWLERARANISRSVQSLRQYFNY